MDAQGGPGARLLEESGPGGEDHCGDDERPWLSPRRHGLWQKQSLFEESARVTLIIAAPGIAKAGGVVASPVGLVDLHPTLAELAGVEDSGQSAGAEPGAFAQGSLRGGPRFGPSARWCGVGDSTGWVPLPAVGDNGKRIFGYSLRTARWRYTEWGEGKEGRELHDHDADPKELINLADLPAQADTVAALSAQLRDAVKGTFPADGRIPELSTTVWSPNLTNP